MTSTAMVTADIAGPLGAGRRPARAVHGDRPRGRSCRRGGRAGGLLAALAVLVAALGPAEAGPASAGPLPVPAKTGTAQAKITADWETFFAGSTPAARKVALLQDGPSFAKIIEGQAGSPLAKSVAAKVSKVTLTSPTKAAVRYSLTLAGQTALSNVEGQAILSGGIWKVGKSSFCALLALEQQKTPACGGRR